MLVKVLGFILLCSYVNLSQVTTWSLYSSYTRWVMSSLVLLLGVCDLKRGVGLIINARQHQHQHKYCTRLDMTIINQSRFLHRIYIVTQYIYLFIEKKSIHPSRSSLLDELVYQFPVEHFYRTESDNIGLTHDKLYCHICIGFIETICTCGQRVLYQQHKYTN